jgi:POT family proton-dependent oligopeptide transporter
VATPDDDVLAAAQERIDEAFRASAATDAARQIPDDESGTALIADIRAAAGRPVRYHRITRDRYRLVTDGPDGEPFTADDVVVAATVVRVDPDVATRLATKPLTWRERRIIELKGEEGRRQVEAARGQAPATTIVTDTTVGGLATLEGAAYYWFWTGCMLAAAIAFVPIAAFYRGQARLQDVPAA